MLRSKLLALCINELTELYGYMLLMELKDMALHYVIHLMSANSKQQSLNDLVNNLLLLEGLSTSTNELIGKNYEIRNHVISCNIVLEILVVIMIFQITNYILLSATIRNDDLSNTDNLKDTLLDVKSKARDTCIFLKSPEIGNIQIGVNVIL